MVISAFSAATLRPGSCAEVAGVSDQQFACESADCLRIALIRHSKPDRHSYIIGRCKIQIAS